MLKVEFQISDINIADPQDYLSHFDYYICSETVMLSNTLTNIFFNILKDFLHVTIFSSITGLLSKQNMETFEPPHGKTKTICICENKGADQLRGNREADQRLCFRYTDSTLPLLPKSEISSF